MNDSQSTAIHLPSVLRHAAPTAEETDSVGSDAWRPISQQASASARAVETIDLIFEWLADDEQLLA